MLRFERFISSSPSDEAPGVVQLGRTADCRSARWWFKSARRDCINLFGFLSNLEELPFKKMRIFGNLTFLEDHSTEGIEGYQPFKGHSSLQDCQCAYSQ